MGVQPGISILLVLFLFSGCGGGGGKGGSQTSGLPVITAFAASPSSISSSQSVSLSWTVSGADALSITPLVGAVTGSSRDVTVSGTTSFTLTASNATGSTQAQATVTLVPAGTVKIIYLHHSTGGNVWAGGVAAYFTNYNAAHGTHYQIEERAYPDSPYPWANYPYDYWNLWVNPSGPADDSNPKVHSLAKLCADYDVIVLKHCYPVSGIEPDIGSPSISSSTRRAENYRLQYAALKTAMNAHPDKKFILWTGAALLEGESSAEQGQRARDFFDWVKNTWDLPGDNIYVWDFYELETEGGNFLQPAYSAGDSHPNSSFCTTVAPLIGKRIVDVIEGRGDTGSLTGQ